MNSPRLLLVMAALTATSCSMMPPPVPITGAPAQRTALAGTWNGNYYSLVTGRHGTIYFRLEAGRDTAYGDVLMLPQRQMQTGTRYDGAVVAPRPEPSPLSISVVHAARDSVYGYLDPYQDPDCECTLVTSFMGRMTGDKIEGRYTSRSIQTGETTTGEWSVRREKQKPKTAIKD